jgi:hypothetical protein
MASISCDFLPGTGRDSLSLSGVCARGDYLFLAPDEGADVVRMRRTAPGHFGEPVHFPLADLLAMPGDPGDEADLEGMAITEDSIWVAGSHSNVRSRVPAAAAPADVAKLLKKVKQPTSRCLLARIPLLPAGPGGAPELTPAIGDRRAARLPARGDGSLRAALIDDKHLGPFLDLPGKDNGLDIEGLAVTGGPGEDVTVLIGLRGPVLRSWAVILEIAPRTDPQDPSRLLLTPLDDADGAVYRKHFVDLGGLGIRDLSVAGDDLLVLTGPTMVIDGPAAILRLRQGAVSPLPPAITRRSLEPVVDPLPVGVGDDHPEGMTVAELDGEPLVLVVYDSPSSGRLSGDSVLCDTHEL